ncbi:MAG TPA: hypothetical protein VHB48_00385 [Chitinophagaceae bacterium]|nr:hypothetical protein [Chitinophagaceae bacterium]
MKLIKYFALLLVLYATIPSPAAAQKVTGKWYGVGYVDMDQVTNNYLCELIITQQGNTVTGEFNYYFRNGYFSNKIKGTFTNNSRYLYLSLLPVMYNRTVNTLTGVDCPMHGEFTLKVARVGSTLSGNFISDDLHKYTCAPLKVNFKKLLDTDPTLKERVDEMKKDTLPYEEAEDQPADTAKNIAQAPPVHDTTAVVAETQPKPAVKLPQHVMADSASKADAERKVIMRAKTLERVLDVYDDSVRVDLYDNAVLDYDTVSVFYNNKLVAYKKLLETKEPIRFYVHVNPDESNNDLVMYAENLGLIPPNSAIMIVTDSGHRYEISLTSDYQKNAAVRLRKGQKPLTQ